MKKSNRRRWALAVVAVFFCVYFAQKYLFVPQRPEDRFREAPLDLPIADFTSAPLGNPLLTAIRVGDALMDANPKSPNTTTSRNGAAPDIFRGVAGKGLATPVTGRPLARLAPLGEHLHFEAVWNGLRVGWISLTTEAVSHDETLLKATAQVGTHPVIEMIYPMRTLFESVFVRRSGITRSYHKDQVEKGRHRSAIIEINPLSRQAHYRRFRREELDRESFYDVPPKVTDPLGSFHLLRNAEVPPGGTWHLDLLNGDELTRIQLVRRADETVIVPLGSFHCQTWVPEAAQLYEDHPDAEVILHLEEHTRIPVKISARLPAPVGRVRLQLASWVKGE